jgi:hypothetical protein
VVNLAILSKTSSLIPKFLETQSQRRKDVPFKGVVDSAHFSSHEKRSYPTFAYTGKHLANYSQRLSIISKQSNLIPKELRYQVKIHAISDMTREKKNLQILPNFFFFFIKQIMQYGNDIICKARSNLMMLIQKNSRSTCFFCLPQQVPAKSSQEKQGAQQTGS